MKHRILIILLTVLSFAAANGKAIALSGSVSSTQVAGIVEDQRSSEHEQVAALHSLMNSLVKVNENDHPVFRLHQLKRGNVKQQSYRSCENQKAWFFFYSRLRNNSIHSSPFYIAFHRLTI